MLLDFAALPFWSPIDRKQRKPRRALFSPLNPDPSLPLDKNNRCTFVVEGFTYNYVVDGSFTFLAVSAER